MKRIFTFLCLFFLTGTFVVNAQNVPNGGFENWSGIYNANGWSSNNTSIYFLRQSTDVHAGNYSAQVSSLANGSAGNLSGILTLGSVNTVTQTVSGGKPINSQPPEVHGYYKYTAGNGADNLIITCTMTKWTGTSRITLCNASFNSPVGQNITSYTLFSIPLTYNPSAIIPDTFNIVVKSSKTTAIVGTVALVDDIAFTPATGFEEEEIFVPAMYPNPANEVVNLHLNGEEYNITVTNMIGQNVAYIKTNERKVSVQTNLLPIGVYFVNVENKAHHYTMKLLINR